MIQSDVKYVHNWHVENYIKENYSKDIDEMSGRELMEILFGVPFHERGSFRIVNDYWQPETNWKHRVNRLWAFPLTVICAPYRYIKYGDIGWSDNTRFGAWLLKVTGY